MSAEAVIHEVRGMAQGAKRATARRTSGGYRGVHWKQEIGKYRVQIKHAQKMKSLGCFTDAAEAARVYDAAAYTLQGRCVPRHVHVHPVASCVHCDTAVQTRLKLPLSTTTAVASVLLMPLRGQHVQCPAQPSIQYEQACFCVTPRSGQLL